MELSRKQIEPIIALALAEDLGQGDVTTDVLIPPDLKARASLLIKEAGVLAGIEVAQWVFQSVDSSLRFDVLIGDGSQVTRGSIAAVLQGKASGMLKAERVALNLLQRMSGIATATALYVGEVSGTRARILDTRKTVPGLRPLERYAVRMGGGTNHRYNLGDAVLIKDNHLAAMRTAGMGLAEVVRKARSGAPAGMKIEVEVNSVEQAREALRAEPDVILLDNMSLADMHQAVEMAKGLALTEASGGITLSTLRAVAETGVDFISVGALTHSVKGLDISLEFEFGGN